MPPLPQAVLRELDGLKCSVNPVSWVGARRATALVQAVQRTGLYRGQRCAVGGWQVWSMSWRRPMQSTGLDRGQR